MEFLEQQFAQYAKVFEGLEYVSLFFLALIILDTVWDFVVRKRTSPKETAANFTIAIGAALLERIGFGVIFIIALALFVPFAAFTIPDAWWGWALAFAVTDFTYYWMHRIEHETRILWANHSVHHSSSEFNLTTALRLSWIESAIEWVFFVPMILVGFSVPQVLICLVIVLEYQTWIHTEKIGKLGFLDKIFNTPSVHRVHHSSNRRFLDKNYGGILIIWDRLFGTYQAEDEVVEYGLTTPINTANPIKINFREYVEIFKDIGKTKGARKVLALLFGRP